LPLHTQWFNSTLSPIFGWHSAAAGNTVHLSGPSANQSSGMGWRRVLFWLQDSTHRHQRGQGHLHEPGHVQPEAPVRAHQHHADEVAELPGLPVPSHLVEGLANLLALRMEISHAIRHQSVGEYGIRGTGIPPLRHPQPS